MREVCIPAGFVCRRAGRRLVVVRAELAHVLGELLLAGPQAAPPGGEPLPGGRGSTYRVALVTGEVVALRLGRRGGLLAGVLGGLYWGSPERPLLELAATVEARRRGVPAPEVLGARVDRLWGGWYRGAIATRYLPGMVSLWEALRGAAGARCRRRLLHACGVAVRALYEAGIYHPDLNLNNCLVRREGGGVEAFLVDFDRARATGRSYDAGLRRRMLRRLERSARRLDPAGRVISAGDLRLLRVASGAEA